jgi:hypothetical protein
VVKPSQVRLNPSVNDPYIWKFHPEKEEHYSAIFSKNISDYSVGVFEELLKGVNNTFEAVPATIQTGNASNSLTTVWKEKTMAG